MPAFRRSLLSTAIALVVTAIPARSPLHSQPMQLVPIPSVSLEAMEPAVRTQLEQQLDTLQSLKTEAEQGSVPPGLAEAYGELGKLYLVYDLAAPARAALNNALALNPTSAQWPYLLGTSYEVDGDAEAAALAYRDALHLASQMQADGTVLHSIQARLAGALIDTNDFEAAAPLYQQLLDSPGFEAAGANGLGRVAAARGDHELAIRLFSAAVAAQPEANQIHYALGLSHRELGNLDQARFHLENRGDGKVRFPDPIAAEVQEKVGGAGAMLTLGRMSYATGDIAAAQQRFERAVEIDPTSAPAHRSLGNLRLNQGDVVGALQSLETAIELAPDDAALRYFVVQILLDPRASTSDEERLRYLTRAAGHLEEIVLIAPDFTEARAALATAQVSLGRFDAADKTYLTALERDPSQIDWHYRRAEAIADRIAAQASSPGAPIAAWGAAGRASLSNFLQGLAAKGRALGPGTELELGLLELRLGDSEPGRRRLNTLLSDGETPPAVAAQAALYLANEAAQRTAQQAAAGSARPEIDADALRLYARALELDETLIEARFNQATLLGRLGRYAEAADGYAVIATQQPSNATVRHSYAVALLLADRESDAKAELEDALERLPEDPRLGNLLARLLTSAEDDSLRDAQVGLDLAFRLFEAFPDPEHAETVAMALAENGEFDKAVEWQSKVIDQLEDLGFSQEQLSESNRRLNQYHALEPERSPWRPRGLSN